MRRFAAAATCIALLGTTACGGEEKSSSAAAEPEAVERCVDRLVAVADPPDEPVSDPQGLRRYARDTYCQEFARRGWVYGDGALAIDAHAWLEAGMAESCESGAEPGEAAETTSCGELGDAHDVEVLDCALLHHVRRSEVAGYLARFPPNVDVTCDDGSDPAEIGVP